MMNYSEIKKITFGIKYKRKIGLPDFVGSIFEEILRDDNSPFNAKYFEKFSSFSSGKVLYNPETKEFIRIDMDNLVISLDVDNFSEDFDDIFNNYIKYFKKNFFKKYEVRNIERLGIIFDFELDEFQPAEHSIKDLTGGFINNPNNIKLKTHQKLPNFNGRMKKGFLDYYNNIITLNSAEDKIYLALDFQSYFKPEVASINDVPLEDFFKKDAMNYLEKFKDKVTNG